jgi:hypothetical protein
MITTDMQQQFSINGFRLGDEADILAMNLAEYGSRDSMVTPDAFHWRFAENPAGQAQITTARDTTTGRLVGFTWTIPIHMRLYGENYVAALTANQLIHPEYRGTLVYARISRRRLQWLHQQQIPFRYNFPTEAIFESTGAAEKMSSVIIPLLVRPLDTGRLLQMSFSRCWISFLFSWGAKAVTPLLFARKPILKQSTSLKIEHLYRFDKRFDAFWERIKDKYAIMTVRDQTFLRWRFAPVAGHTYHVLAAMTGDELVGYIVLRITDEIRGIPSGLVMDLLLDTGGLALPHTDEYNALRTAGYRPLPERLAPRVFRVAYNCFSDDLPETSQVKESDMFFSIADYEAH